MVRTMGKGDDLHSCVFKGFARDDRGVTVVKIGDDDRLEWTFSCGV